MISRESLLALAAPLCRLAGHAGRLILEVYGSEFAVAEKKDRTPITEADRRSHKLITDALAELALPPVLPQPLPVLSEEGRDIPYEERRGWEKFWMVDPLDGTKEFVSRNGEFTVNIALIQAGRPVCGVVYAPVPDVLYFGAQGEGAFRLDNVQAGKIDERIRERIRERILWSRFRKIPESSAPRTGSPTMRSAGSPALRVVGSRSHGSAAFDAFLETLKEGHRQVELTTAGSSLKFCHVAEGKADVYPRLGPTMEWDTAAGHAVALAAGRSVKVIDAQRNVTRRDLAYNKRELINEWFICR
jgi:3'(2'), 5'-bisphosphate nucleotidase